MNGSNQPFNTAEQATARIIHLVTRIALALLTQDSILWGLGKSWIVQVASNCWCTVPKCLGADCDNPCQGLH